MGIDDRTGSLDVGKDADIVIWNGPPLSSYALADKVFIDGDLYFDRSLPGYGLAQFKGTPGVGSAVGAGAPGEDGEVH
jgi:cytosine/adenosine deaminase-related metal-dependent hydrolase